MRGERQARTRPTATRTAIAPKCCNAKLKNDERCHERVCACILHLLIHAPAGLWSAFAHPKFRTAEVRMVGRLAAAVSVAPCPDGPLFAFKSNIASFTKQANLAIPQCLGNLYPHYSHYIGHNRPRSDAGWKDYDRLLPPGRPFFGGRLQRIIDKILYEHSLFRHDRPIAQIDINGLPFAKIADTIELLRVHVLPAVRKAISGARRCDGTERRSGAELSVKGSKEPGRLRVQDG